MLRQLITILFISLCSIAYAQDPYYHEIKPQKGDGVLSLLRRYHLEKDGCNIKTFYSINSMKKGEGLKGHKKYKLPVYIYPFNGKTIRSSIGLNDYKQALAIQRYNERLTREGRRHKSFRKSKLLWVPQKYIGCSSEQKIVKNKTANKKDEVKQQVTPKKENKDVANTKATSVDTLKKDTKATETPTIEQKVKSKKKRNESVAKAKTKTSNNTKTGKLGYKQEKLFGKKLAKVAIKDNSLKGHYYYIVSGHGGPDPGAQCIKCPKTMCEDEYAYDIGLRLGRDLMEHGAVVNFIVQDKNDGIRDEKYLKCDKDERVNGKKMPLNQKRRLNQRVAYLNALYRRNQKRGAKKQVAIYLHVDSQNAKRKQDVYFYHKRRSTAGEKLCKKVVKNLKKRYNEQGSSYAGHVSSRGLYVLNYTQPVAVFAELANIKNKKNHQRLILASNREILAQWIYEGLTKK